MDATARRELREKAMAALRLRPGPWVRAPGGLNSWFIEEKHSGDIIATMPTGNDYLDDLAAYIAAAHPGVVIELLDDGDRWRDAVRSILTMAGFNPEIDAATAVHAMKAYTEAATQIAEECGRT